MSSTSAPPDQDRSFLRRVIGRILFALALLLIFLFGLVYCTTHSRSGSDASRTPPLPTYTKTIAPTPTPTLTPTPSMSAAPTSTGGATAGASRSTKAGKHSTTGKHSKAGGSTARSGTAPRSAPNTGGGSASGAVDLRLVTGGVLLVLASIALASITLRRWRRAW